MRPAKKVAFVLEVCSACCSEVEILNFAAWALILSGSVARELPDLAGQCVFDLATKFLTHSDRTPKSHSFD
ncbi:hypothetical protein T01_7705 [Trichinella spiralis]|uniref:Uncharacterized protein n=1 Tax=Trichinella spiralis TaxID=6334 RepID=A0A0V1BQB1_TRISP|nr:hypothetical protein T01_7705 [Trichinella spiralis]